MSDMSGEIEDELIDLNKEPVEGKKKRIEGDKSVEKMGNKACGSFGIGCRLLRSVNAGNKGVEKKEIDVDFVNEDDENASELALVEEETEEIKVPEDNPEKKKGKRGRPRKIDVESEVSLMGNKSKVKKPIAKNDEGNKPVKRRGRLPKVENGDTRLLVKEKTNKGLKRNSIAEQLEHGVRPKRLKIGDDKLVEGVSKKTEKKAKVKDEDGEKGLREKKQLVRDEIVDMLLKAGWTVEHRQRQSKEYQDAVYVDRRGRTHWSVTLAYKKLKQKIDEGKGEEIDILAFKPIPEETFRMLFRTTVKGRKAGKKKKNCGVKVVKKKKKVTKKETRRKCDAMVVKSRSNKVKQRTLSARKPLEGSDGNGYELYKGKRNLLSWMIDMGTLKIGEEVRYRHGRGNKIVLQGKITKEGICCGCCNKNHTVQEFKLHSKIAFSDPYQRIYLGSGVNLYQCLVNSWKRQVMDCDVGFVRVDVDGDDPNDDTCNVCGDGGDLICCDSCPSTFHRSCLRIEVPTGDWNCVYCSCKFCKGACVRMSEADDDRYLIPKLLTCRLCDEKFHVHCSRTFGDLENEYPSFCGEECFKIFRDLQVLLGVTHELEDGFSCTVLCHRAINDNLSDNSDSLVIESNSKLAVAFTVLDECFNPIIDERSGTNIIHSIVYNRGSNMKRLNYDGFYTIVLEKGDEIVSAASLRIHGPQLAEMPFIGTRYIYRRQGLCSKLLTGIEKVLCSVGVHNLVVPAISELNSTWTKVFGFSPLEESARHEIRHMNLVVFPRVEMLKKPMLLQHQHIPSDSKGNEIDAEYPICQTVASSDAVPKESSEVKSSVSVKHTQSAEAETDDLKDSQEVQDKANGVVAASSSDTSSVVEIPCNEKVKDDEHMKVENRSNNLETPEDDDRNLPLDVKTTIDDGGESKADEEQPSVMGNKRKRKKRGEVNLENQMKWRGSLRDRSTLSGKK